MRIHYFQHVPFETPGMIAEWAATRGHSLSSTLWYQPHVTLPATDDYDVLLIMGGPMGVYDVAEYPWLEQEKALIRSAVVAGKRVFGICLGAQLIAAALGATVKPHHQKEIGWFPTSFTDAALNHPLFAGMDKTPEVLHWHGDRFEIPAGAMRIASSEACDNQGFLYDNRVLGLQFHLEIDADGLSDLIDACRHELTDGKYIEPAETLLEKARTTNTRNTLFRLLDAWSGT